MYKRLTIFTVLFLLIDQITKFFISYFMDLGQSINVIPNFFKLTYVHNYGAAFSLFVGKRLIFILIALLFIFLICKFFIKGKDLNFLSVMVYSLLLGGIIGNLIDRIFYGYVIDFLSFNIFGYNFAIFNLADTFIVISICLILIMGDNNARYSKNK